MEKNALAQGGDALKVYDIDLQECELGTLPADLLTSPSLHPIRNCTELTNKEGKEAIGFWCSLMDCIGY